MLGEAARRQRSRREEGDVERKGRATVAPFARRRWRRRCGARGLFGAELLRLALARVRSRLRPRHDAVTPPMARRKHSMET